MERSDLESVFLGCVDEVRKHLLKRRVKQEIVVNNRSKNISIHSLKTLEGSTEGQQLEQSIMKLVNFAKGRVKFEEFNSQDKQQLLELFVTSEETLLAVYNALFPKNT